MGTRLPSLDRLRGLVMVLMAVDHVRDFVGADVPFLGIDVARLGAPLFLTRWITHFCAPVFLLLAGASVGLQVHAGKPVPELRRFLVTRGLFLVLLELTVIDFGWTFDPGFHAIMLGVIWVIGWSMVALAAFVGRPVSLALVFGLVAIVGHHLLDGLRAESFGAFAPLFSLLHEPHDFEPFAGHRVIVLYPFVPWVGVMTAGYALASWLVLPEPARRVRLVTLGLGVTLAFVILRGANLHVDPRPFTPQATPGLTLLSILDCTKYPPSAAYLAMTLGPALVALAFLDRLPAPLASPLEALGRAPLVYYVLHIYVAHLGAIVLYLAVYGRRVFDFAADPETRPRFPLVVVYLGAFAIAAALVPVCRRFSELKRRRKDLAILSYV